MVAQTKRYVKFSGTKTAYRMLHLWVERQLGKPKFCVECGKNDPAKRYDWANISGDYKKDTNDWQRMCRQCHTKMDMKRELCVQGHPLIGDNLVIHKLGHRKCRICKNKSNRNYRKNKKEKAV